MGETEETRALRRVASGACLMAAQLFDNGAGHYLMEGYLKVAADCNWLLVRLATEQPVRLGYEALRRSYQLRSRPGWADPRLQALDIELERRWERWDQVAAQHGPNYSIIVQEPGRAPYLLDYVTTDQDRAVEVAKMQIDNSKLRLKATVQEAWGGREVWPLDAKENDGERPD